MNFLFLIKEASLAILQCIAIGKNTQESSMNSVTCFSDYLSDQFCNFKIN